MIDVHAHFADEGYLFPEEWNGISAAGVSKVILAGDTVKHSQMHRDFCKEYEGAYFCAGVHPSETRDFNGDTVEALSALCKEKKCVAVGEVGLDYHYPDTDKEKQKAAFITQILLAEEERLPLQIHSRDSAEDMLNILTDMKAHLERGFLLHCYSHGNEMMKRFLSLGAYFSFGGISCFKNATHVFESIQTCPRDRLLTETDSPYLSPFRGEKNSPKNIPVILERLSTLRGEEKETLEKQIEQNAKTLFPRLQ